MKYKLFISDFDWTLGLAPDKIEPETVNAIKEYEKKGGKFVICTGRSYPTIKCVCEKYGLGGLVVCFQGALGMEIETDKVVFGGGVENQVATEIALDLMGEGVEVGAYIDNLFHYDKKGAGIETYERLVGASGRKVDNLAEVLKETKKPIRKILTIQEPKIKDMLLEKYSKKYENRLILNASSECFLEIINPKWNKGNGVKRIAEYYNVPLSEVIAVGDSLNDLELIRGEWHGVIVGDGMEEVKKYAKEVTVPFNEQPIKHLLEKYCL